MRFLSTFLLAVVAWTGTQASGTSPQTPAAPPAPRPTTAEVRVTDRAGAPLDGAKVMAEGPQSRDGLTDKAGVVSFRLTAAGTYRLRIERSGFITLEKEVAVKAATSNVVDAALTAAPAPPAPPPVVAPPVAPPPSAPVLVAGAPAVVFVADLADEDLKARSTDPLKEHALGCSGATSSRLMTLKGDTLAVHTHADADETIYVMAGEGTLRMSGKDYPLAPGWFALVPRGVEHLVTRKGRTPLVMISSVSGPACGK